MVAATDRARATSREGRGASRAAAERVTEMLRQLMDGIKTKDASALTALAAASSVTPLKALRAGGVEPGR